MALKRALPSAAKKQLADEIMCFLEAHKSEAEQRHSEYYEKADKFYFKIRDDICKAAESILPKVVLDAKLLDFMHNDDTGNSEELVAPCASHSSENIDIASEAVAAFENLSIPVEKTSTTHSKRSKGFCHDLIVMHTRHSTSRYFPRLPNFVAPPPNGYMRNNSSVHTPLQEKVDLAQIPLVIHPKVENIRKHHFRAARRDEVAFSVDGSPIVALPSDQNYPEAHILKQIMEENDYAFSPKSREVVSTFKDLLRRKATEAAAHSLELD